MSRWPSKPLYAVAPEVRETVDPTVFGDDEVDHYSIPALDATGKPEVVPANEILSGKQRLRGGEVMVSRLNPRKARVLAIPPLDTRTALASGEFVVVRPVGIETRFLTYVLLAESTRQHLDSMVQSVTRSHQRIRPEHLMKLPVPVPAARDQRAIADYLDAETARIDAMIAKKRRLIELLDEWLDVTRTRLLSDAERTTPLMHLTDPTRQIMYGIVLPGPDVPDGVPIVKGGDVAKGLAGVAGLCRTTAEIESSYARSRLREGDLVFAIRGGIGDVAIVPSDVAGANITQDVARVSPAASVDRRWLFHVLRSRGVQEQAVQRTTGATIRGLNIWELKRIAIPLVPLSEQRAVGAEIDRAQETADQGQSALARQIDLLVEHRQALITAAVTGEIEVPGVAA